MIINHILVPRNREYQSKYFALYEMAARRQIRRARAGALQQESEEDMKRVGFGKLPLALLAALGLMIGSASVRAADENIVDTAVAAGNFTTLVAALKAAGLIGTLEGPGPFTVFAPTDAAFAKLPAGTLDNLLKPENKAQLIQILTYHVVAGKMTSGQLTKLKAAKTVNGQMIPVKLSGRTVSVDGADVAAADITASNGLNHVIDAVMLPPKS
jgi:uncharacterized surface protein with fasciclin (FAS1) repeats